jgi:hypothetical protein
MWLRLWTPELRKDSTCVIVSGVDTLPAWAISELALIFSEVRGGGDLPPFVLTAHESIPRDEIVRGLAEPGTTVVRAAAKLGMGRVTIYRRMAQYGIKAHQLRS